MRIEASIRVRTKRYARLQAFHANSPIDQTILSVVSHKYYELNVLPSVQVASPIGNYRDGQNRTPSDAVGAER